MSKIHYYFGWFDGIVPKQAADLINKDLKSKKSIAVITTAPADNDYTDSMLAFTKDVWFEPAGILFEEYQSIDYRISKEKAQEILKNACAILLHGGYPAQLKSFIDEYGLADAIKQSTASVIMGASAGGMNMSLKFGYGEWIDDKNRKPAAIFEGLGLDDFALISHASAKNVDEIVANDYISNALIPISYEIDAYVACTESIIRSDNGKLSIMGDVFLISKGQITKCNPA